MAVKFRKSINLGGGVKLNISKSSMGISAGGKHGRVSVNTKGQVTKSASLPGTGLSFQERTSLKSSTRSKGLSANNNLLTETQESLYDAGTIIPQNRKQVESVAAPVEDSFERMVAFARIGVKASIVSPYGDDNLCVVCGKKKGIFTKLTEHGYCASCNEKVRVRIVDLIKSVIETTDYIKNAPYIDESDKIIITSTLNTLDDLEKVRPYAPFFKMSLLDQRQILKDALK